MLELRKRKKRNFVPRILFVSLLPDGSVNDEYGDEGAGRPVPQRGNISQVGSSGTDPDNFAPDPVFIFPDPA